MPRLSNGSSREDDDAVNLIRVTGGPECSPEQAVTDYSFVVDVWRHADEILQPYVSEAREALQRLTGEPGG